MHHARGRRGGGAVFAGNDLREKNLTSLDKGKVRPRKRPAAARAAAEGALDLTLDDATIERLIGPYVVRRFRANSPEWQSHVAALARRWRRKKLLRRWLGWLPSSTRLPQALRGKRTQNYVRESYDGKWTRRHWAGPDNPDAKVKLTPIGIFDDFPQKVRLGLGMVLAIVDGMTGRAAAA